MKIYLAARYSRLEEVLENAEELMLAGHEVTSRWIFGSHEWSRAEQAAQAEFTDVPLEAQKFALDDVNDVQDAEMVICFSDPPRDKPQRGGKHFEFGVAWSMGKECVVVGPRENVFHCLPEITHYSSWKEFKDAYDIRVPGGKK